MKTWVMLAAVIAIVIIACGKDTPETVPSLKFVSKNADVIEVNGTLRVTLEFTDSDGDIHDVLGVKKQRLNKRVVPTLRDSLIYQIPSYPDMTRGEFEVNLDYQSVLSAITPPNVPGSNPPRKEPDTLNLRFAVRDNAGHASDTVTIGPIIVCRSTPCF